MESSAFPFLFFSALDASSISVLSFNYCGTATELTSSSSTILSVLQLCENFVQRVCEMAVSLKFVEHMPKKVEPVLLHLKVVKVFDSNECLHYQIVDHMIL